MLPIWAMESVEYCGSNLKVNCDPGMTTCVTAWTDHYFVGSCGSLKDKTFRSAFVASKTAAVHFIELILGTLSRYEMKYFVHKGGYEIIMWHKSPPKG